MYEHVAEPVKPGAGVNRTSPDDVIVHVPSLGSAFVTKAYVYGPSPVVGDGKLTLVGVPSGVVILMCGDFVTFFVRVKLVTAVVEA